MHGKIAKFVVEMRGSLINDGNVGDGFVQFLHKVRLGGGCVLV